MRPTIWVMSASVTFSSSKDRVERMAQMIVAKEKLNLDDVRHILLDVKSERSL